MLTAIYIISALLLPIYNNIWATSLVSLMMASLYMICAVYPSSPFSTSFSNIMFTDYFNAPLIILTLWISALMILASYTIVFKNNSPLVFLFLILSLNSILVLTFSSTSIILLYILFEASLIPTLFLILGWGYQPERLQAGFYLIIYTVLASLPLLMNLFLMFNLNKSLMFLNFYWAAPCYQSFFKIWWLTLILAFLVKMPLYLFHLWLPKAHVEAPIAGSMILAGILLKLGSYGLIRMASIFPYINSMLLPMLAALSMWGAVITSMICTRQPDMKSLIAYSSVGHMGLLTAGAMTSSAWGWEGVLLMMTAHGLCSSALFVMANCAYETTHTRSIFLTKGMLSLFPAMTILWFLLSAANMAAPPSLNLVSEIMLLTSILYTSPVMFISIALTSFLAAVYSLFLFTATQHGHPATFLAPLSSFSPRNHHTIYMHIVPLFLMILKSDFIFNWAEF